MIATAAMAIDEYLDLGGHARDLVADCGPIAAAFALALLQIGEPSLRIVQRREKRLRRSQRRVAQRLRDTLERRIPLCRGRSTAQLFANGITGLRCVRGAKIGQDGRGQTAHDDSSVGKPAVTSGLLLVHCAEPRKHCRNDGNDQCKFDQQRPRARCFPRKRAGKRGRAERQGPPLLLAIPPGDTAR